MPKKFFDIIPPSKIEPEPETSAKTKPLPQDIDRGKIVFKEVSKPKRIFPKVLIFCFFILILGFGVLGFSFFSKVEIEIWPETDNLTFKETITVDSQVDQVDFAAGIIPGKVFEDQKFDSQEFSSSGRTIKEEKAKGIIRVYNAASTFSRTLIPSRFVSADGKLFWSLKKVVIPGAKYEKGKLVPGYTDLEVQATEPGEEYNIGPSTFALPALAGTTSYTTIYGRSFSPMTSGLKGEVSQVTQEDLDRAENSLTEELKKESIDFLNTALPPDYILLLKAISQEAIEAYPLVEAGGVAELFNFQAKIKSKGLAFKKVDIENFAKTIINSNIQEGKKIQEESLEIKYSPQQLDAESGKIVLDLEIKAKVFSDIDLVELKKALLGRSFEEAEIFLENLPQIAESRLRFPFWRRKIPEDINKVEIVLRVD